MIPENILKLIKDESKKAGENQDAASFEYGAEFGYNLAQSEISRLHSIIENLFKYDTGYNPSMTQQEAWEQFKKTNNL